MMWTALILAIVLCYAFKVAGLSVPPRVLENPRVRRVAAVLPVGMLGALIATQAFSSGQQLTLDARAAGLVVGIVAVALRAPFLVVVVLAAATAALLRAFT